MGVFCVPFRFMGCFCGLLLRGSCMSKPLVCGFLGVWFCGWGFRFAVVGVAECGGGD